MQHDDPRAVHAVEDAARWFDNLPIAAAIELGRPRAALRKLLQLLDVRDDALHEGGRRGGIVERDVVGDSLKVSVRSAGPDYFCQRAIRFCIRFFTAAWERTRPSA